ncbi:nucleotide-binding protein [Pseudomonas orientalis]|uniref:CD-NTase-associated protein 12/Pycsar effector protein TIR domain-containing protein n=1 Tax=Pseudomonas orientalis TaxID=76758 RepID=A0A2L0S1A4_9PSED|nr:nucleotide-binding protein [Pseudomonas orientalis]AUZ48050.1 hypothetical protein BOP93_21455 [Pseudomonas orientalis]
MKPKIFIGSSREGLDIANAIHSNLTRDAECTVWANGVFQISGSTIYSLIKTLRESDFGVFVFSPDDLSVMRGNENPIVRDNVIFELGLFVGRLGIERCFFITPDVTGDLRLPTDLMGITPGQYESGRRDKNWLAATNPVCMQIRAKLLELKSFQDAVPETSPSIELTSEEQAPVEEAYVPLTLEAYGKGHVVNGSSMVHKAELKKAGAKWNGTLKKWIIRGIDKDAFDALILKLNAKC